MTKGRENTGDTNRNNGTGRIKRIGGWEPRKRTEYGKR